MKAVYPGAFDPVTYGHIDLMRRGSKLFDQIVVAVASVSRKNVLFSVEERISLIEGATMDVDNLVIKPLNGLLVDFAKEQGASVIVRGLRAVSDFDYELQMSLTNRRLADSVETVFMMPSEEHLFVSSSLIKEIASLGGEIKSMAPDNVRKALSAKLKHDGERG